MKIALDVSCIARAHRTGIGEYAYHLVNALAESKGGHRYYLCYRLSRLKKKRFFHTVEQDNFRLKIIQEPFNFLFPRNIDVFHGLDARLPAFRGPQKVATLHDLFAMISTDFADPAFIKKKVDRYRRLARQAGRIIAVSQSTRRDIVERLGVSEDKIDVIPLGVDPIFRPVPGDEAIATLRGHGIAGPYILFVGNLETRKNLLRMLEAFRRLPAGLRRNLNFVLAGKQTYGGDKVRKTLEEKGLTRSVKTLGYVPGRHLPALYSGAEAFMFPTLYEGFGIPIVESMACGTPVITSNLSANPEVAGDAALLVDPTDTDAIAEALCRLLEEQKLRKTLSQRGLRRAARFTWRQTAERTLEVYAKLAEPRA